MHFKIPLNAWDQKQSRFSVRVDNMKFKVFLALVLLFVVHVSSEEWDLNDPSDILYKLKEGEFNNQLNKLFRDGKLLSWSEMYKKAVDDSNEVPAQSETIINEDGDDQLFTTAEIQFNTAELNILRDNEEPDTSNQVHKEEDKKVNQEKSAQINEAKDDDDGEEDKEEDIEEEEERYSDDTDIIRSRMIKNDSDIYLQALVIFVCGFVLGGAISFFFMSIKNRYGNLKEVQLVLDA